MEELLHFLSLSALISAGNPLELVKSRIQTMNELIDKGTIQNRYSGIFDCVKHIKLNEGIRALWKGNAVGVLRFFPNQKINNDVKNFVRQNLPASSVSNVLAGVTAGWTAAAILYPVDTLRIFISTSIKKSRQTVRQVKNKFRVEGTRFLYQGYSSSMLNIALFRGTYFGMFDTLKDFSSTFEEKWMAAYLSGLSAGLLVYPSETIRKKKILTENKLGYRGIISKTFEREGLMGFYKGCSLIPFQSIIGAIVLMYFDSRLQKN